MSDSSITDINNSQSVRFVFTDAKEETLIDSGSKALRYHTGSAKLNLCMSHAWRICFVVEKKIQSIRWSVKLRIIVEWEIFINGLSSPLPRVRDLSMLHSSLADHSLGARKTRKRIRQSDRFALHHKITFIFAQVFWAFRWARAETQTLQVSSRDYCLFERWKWNIVDAHNLFLSKKLVSFLFLKCLQAVCELRWVSRHVTNQ